METKIIDFCKKYIEKKKLDKDIAEVKLDAMSDYRDRISFHVIEVTHTPLTYGGGRGIEMPLDKEDLEYLFNKYSKKLIKEREENIKEINEMYDNLKHISKGLFT